MKILNIFRKNTFINKTLSKIKKTFYKKTSKLNIKQKNVFNEKTYETNEFLETLLKKEQQKNYNLNQKVKFLHLEHLKIEEENKHLQFELKNIVQQQEKYKEELLKTISQQRCIIEDKHLYISILEQKIKTLMGEIKNILKIEKTLSLKQASYINTKENHKNSTYCKKLVESKIDAIIKDFISCSETYNFTYPSKNSIDSFVNTYSINYRVFFDKLKKDERYAIFFYSEQENKIIFINDLFINLIGGNPNFLPNSFSKDLLKKDNKWSQNNYIFKKKPEGFIEIKTKKMEVVTFYYIVKKISINNLSFFSVGILLPLNNKNC